MRGIFSIAKRGDVVLRQPLDPLGVGERGEEADEDAPLPEPARLLRVRRDHLDHRVRAPGVPGRGSGLGEEVVRQAGVGAGARLDHHLVALPGELAHDLGHERDTALAGGRLGGDSDPQGSGTVPERQPIRTPVTKPAAWAVASTVAASRGGAAGLTRAFEAAWGAGVGRVTGFGVGRRGRGRGRCGRCLPRPRHRGERERLAGERRERLGGHPHGGLAAGARVLDLAARGGERAQVGDRGLRAVAALAVRVAAGGDERLDRPRRRLRVRGPAGLQRVAAVRVLAAGEEAGRAADGRRPAPPRGDERLQRGAGVVDPGGRPLPREVEAAVAVGLARDPARGGA